LRCWVGRLSQQERGARDSAAQQGQPAAAGSMVQSTMPPPPNSFLCPITREVMRDPVTTADGHSYERAAITQWLRLRRTSPVTGLLLANTSLTRAHAFRNAIGEWQTEQLARAQAGLCFARAHPCFDLSVERVATLRPAAAAAAATHQQPLQTGRGSDDEKGEGQVARSVAGTAVCGGVGVGCGMEEGVHCMSFTLLRARGRVVLGVVGQQHFDPCVQAWATDTPAGWGLSCASGALRHDAGQSDWCACHRRYQSVEPYPVSCVLCPVPALLPMPRI
jgi:hypothetical protein